jgi:hypothetical protein
MQKRDRDYLPARRQAKVAEVATTAASSGWMKSNFKAISSGRREAVYLGGSTLSRFGGERW